MLLEENICSFCDQIKRFATEAVKEDSYFAIIENPIVEKAWLPLPSIKEKTSVFLQVLSEIEVREQLKDHGIHRFYGKNRMSTGQTLATHIWMGDYHVHEDGRMATFEALAQKSQGVKRIGILRADVDNLGQAFVSGLLRKKESM